MKTLANLAAVFAIALPSAAIADPPLPKPVSEMECLVGNWRITGSFSAGADKAKIDGSWTCKRTSAKYGVLCTLQITGIPGLPVYSETDLFGFDPGTSTYHWFSVTNGGETHDHVAKMPNGPKIQFVYNGTQDGKAFKEVIDLEFGKDKKSMTLRGETFVDGASASVIAGTARKAGAR
jgi:hypothetical protein